MTIEVMNIDVHSFLGAASGAIPTLLLALVFQRPLLMGLVKVAGAYRDFMDLLATKPVGKLLFLLAPGGSSALARNIDFVIITLGSLGMISSVALQAVPAAAWKSDETWKAWAEPVFWTHLGVVSLLAVTVGAGLLVIARGARSSALASSGGPAAVEPTPDT